MCVWQGRGVLGDESEWSRRAVCYGGFSVDTNGRSEHRCMRAIDMHHLGPLIELGCSTPVDLSVSRLQIGMLGSSGAAKRGGEPLSPPPRHQMMPPDLITSNQGRSRKLAIK